MLWAVLSRKTPFKNIAIPPRWFEKYSKKLAIFFIAFVFQELQEENRTLKRQIARQERDLARFTGAEGDLPVILRSNNSSKDILSIFISM